MSDGSSAAERRAAPRRPRPAPRRSPGRGSSSQPTPSAPIPGPRRGLQVRQVGAGRLEHGDVVGVEEVRDGHEGPGPAAREDVGGLGALEPGVDRHEDGARLEEAEHGDDPLASCWAPRSPPGRRARRPTPPGRRRTCGPLEQLGLGEPDVAVDDGHRSPLLGGGREHRRDAVTAAADRVIAPPRPSTFISRARLPPMILRTISSGAPGQLVDVAGRVGEALGVGEVGAEQHVLLTDQLGQRAEVLLPERADVDVALEDRRPGPRGSPGASSCRCRPGCLRSGSTQLLPFSITAILSVGKRDRAPWQISADDGVLDRPPRRQHPERLGLERQHLAVAAHPLVGVALVAAVGGVHGRRGRRARRPSPRTGRTRAGRTSGGRGSRAPAPAGSGRPWRRARPPTRAPRWPCSTIGSVITGVAKMRSS